MSFDSSMDNQSAEMEVQNKRIAGALGHVKSDGNDFLNGSHEARERLVPSARNLVSAAESPVESLIWHIWALPTRTLAARIAIDLKLFETIARDCAKTNEQLATVTGASPKLVQRITRLCASANMMDEKESGIYAANAFTRLLVQP